MCPEAMPNAKAKRIGCSVAILKGGGPGLSHLVRPKRKGWLRRGELQGTCCRLGNKHHVIPRILSQPSILGVIVVIAASSITAVSALLLIFFVLLMFLLW